MRLRIRADEGRTNKLQALQTPWLKKGANKGTTAAAVPATVAVPADSGSWKGTKMKKSTNSRESNWACSIHGLIELGRVMGCSELGFVKPMWARPGPLKNHT